MNTHLEVSDVDAGNYEVKAVQGQVVTLHSIAVDPQFREQLGLGTVDGKTLIREAVEILVEHEAMAAVPADTRLEQLVSHYPYLGAELQDRLSNGSVKLPPVEPPFVGHRPAEDHPTHT